MQNLGVINAHNGRKKFLHSQVKIVHETGIINNAGIIYIGKTYLDGCAKDHISISPFNNEQADR